MDSQEGNNVTDSRKKRKRGEGGSPITPKLQLDYFPASCEHMFGPLPIPTHSLKSDVFPHNIIFRTADWVSNEIAEDAEGYDVVVA